MFIRIVLLSIGLFFNYAAHAQNYQTPPHFVQTYDTQTKLTPAQALTKLQDGNVRFLNNQMRQRDFALQTKLTAQGQAPFAVILSCMDSRGSPEILFDQGIGDIFSLRVAGNVINDDILASLEFGTKVVGSKLIVVMGHTQCGAVDAACSNVKLGHITKLLANITPAVNQVQGKECTLERVNAIARENVLNMMQIIPQQSSIIQTLVDSKKILIVGAMHDLATGKITFFDKDGNSI